MMSLAKLTVAVGKEVKNAVAETEASHTLYIHASGHKRLMMVLMPQNHRGGVADRLCVFPADES